MPRGYGNSPNVVEEKFCEVHSSKLGRAARGLGTRTGAERGFGANCHHAGLIRYQESLQAVATCYRWTSREIRS